jgi:hypothetical protein
VPDPIPLGPLASNPGIVITSFFFGRLRARITAELSFVNLEKRMPKTVREFYGEIRPPREKVKHSRTVPMMAKPTINPT